MTPTAFMNRARRCGLTFAEVKASLLTAPIGRTASPIGVNIDVDLRAAIHRISSATAEIKLALAKAGITFERGRLS